jgi:SAM-dependent methyltransferase
MSNSLVQQQFGAHAAAYTSSAPHARGESLTRIVEVAAPQPHWSALDIATGAGHVAAALAPRVASVIASDVTPEMLEQAGMLAARRGLANMTTAVADAERLPFPDARFDLVTCRIAPHHFRDVPRFVAEARRVLRPGGTFALVDNIAPDAHSLPQFPAAMLREAAVAYNTFEKLRDPSHVRCLTLGEWLELIEDAGLRLRHREILAKPMSFPDWLDRMQVAGEVRSRLEEMLATASPALAALLAPHQRADGLWFKVDEAVIAAEAAAV